VHGKRLLHIGRRAAGRAGAVHRQRLGAAVQSGAEAMKMRIAVALALMLLAGCGTGPVCVDEAMCRYDQAGDCIPPCAAERGTMHVQQRRLALWSLGGPAPALGLKGIGPASPWSRSAPSSCW
jgi:hypothetical protein